MRPVFSPHTCSSHVPDILTVEHAAHSAQRARFRRLVYNVYVGEQGMMGDVADHVLQEVSDAIDGVAEHFLAVRAGNDVGCFRLWFGADDSLERYADFFTLKAFDPALRAEEIAVLGRVCVPEHCRGQGVFKRLIQHALERCAARGVRWVFLNCPLHLVRSYEDFGWARYGHAIHDEAFGMMEAMCLDLHRHPASTTAAKHPKPRRPRREPHLDLPFFRMMTSEEQAVVQQGSAEVVCKQGARFIRKGAPYLNPIVVLDGEVEAQMGHTTIPLAVGSVVGETAHLLRMSRQADVRAVCDDVRLLVLSASTLGRLAEDHPELGTKVYRNMAEMAVHDLRCAGATEFHNALATGANSARPHAPSFSELPSPLLAALCSDKEILHLRSGEVAASAETERDGLLVVLSGGLTLHTQGQNDVQLAAGSVAGKVAWLSDALWSADLAAGRCGASVVWLGRDDIARATSKAPRVAYDMHRWVATTLAYRALEATGTLLASNLLAR